MNTERVKSFIIADNQGLTHTGLKALVNSMFVSVPVWEVDNKKELIAHLGKESNAIVVLDYALMDFNGADDVSIAMRRFPQTYWFFISNELSRDFASRMSTERNVAIVLKDVSLDELRTALTCAAKGERFFCHQISDMLLDKPKTDDTREHLTPTEIEVLKLIAQGKTVKEIAALRFSSTHTIISHKKNIFRKLDVNNIFEATRYAMRAGLVEIIDYYI